ncbi:MAG: ribonuclease HI family protein [bacterium]|nr:ribonuclease HI family protein [bacterium]
MIDLVIHTDGASRGNPGQASIGAVIANGQGRVLKEVSEYIGIATNNVAEYTAILRALEEAQKLIPENERETTFVELKLDSQLAARQLEGTYKVKNKNLYALYMKIHNMRVELFPHLTITHVRREFNVHADALANRALDERF